MTKPMTYEEFDALRLAISNPQKLYSSQGKLVVKNSVTRVVDGLERVTLGFAVCKIAEHVSEDAADQIARSIDFAERFGEDERATIVSLILMVDQMRQRLAIYESFATFRAGDHVRKKSGSQWQGHVCGFYSTDLTAEGYCVESEHHDNSVQIYPVGALELVPKPKDKIDFGKTIQAAENLDA